MLDGSTVDYGKTAVVELMMENKLLSLDVIVVPRIACQFQMILGMNAINAVGGVYITASSEVHAHPAAEMVTATTAPVTAMAALAPVSTSQEENMVIDDDDFVATF